MYMSDDGFGSSDQILDGARGALTFFQTFIPVYDEAAGLAGGGNNRGITFANGIQRPYDEQLGINFSKLRADAEHLRAAIEGSEDHLNTLSQRWASLAGWTGEASNAGRRHHDRFNGNAAAFLQGASRAPGAIAGAATNIQNALVDYTEKVKGLRSDQCGGMTIEEVRGAIQTARGDLAGMDAKYFLAKAFDMSAGAVMWLLTALGHGASDYVRQQLMEAAKQRLRYFLQDFDDKKTAFDGFTTTVQQAIQRDYDTMLGAMKPMTTEAFKDLPDPAPLRDGTTPAGTVQGVRRERLPQFPGGQTTPSGSGTPVGGTPQQPPSVPGPQQTQATGAVASIPQQVPVRPPGQQGPPGRQPEPVTIRHGNSTVTVSPPDASGRVRLSVSDGNGPPKTYDLGFSRATTASGAIGGPGQSVPPLPPAAAAGPAAGSPSPGVPPLTAIGGGTGSPSGSTPTAPTPRLPSSLFPWSDKPAAPLLPDEDGKVVIKDGDVTITVEPDELTDQLKITLDDGQGHQTTYRVDYQDPAHPTLHQGAELESHQFGPTGSVTPTPLPSPDPGADLAGVGVGSSAGAGASSGFGGGTPISAGGLGLPGGPGGSAGQLEPGAFTGQHTGPPAGQTGPAAAPVGASAQQGGAPVGGMPMMGGMGMAGQGGEDKERGPNKLLGKQDVFTDDSEQRRRAVKAGGVIGEKESKK